MPENLIGKEITRAFVAKYKEDLPWPDGNEQYTFYVLKTVDDPCGVTIRWYGESNGFYSVDVDFEQIEA